MSIPSALPEPRAWSPARELRWGVIAPGWIATRFVRAIHRHTRHRAIAVGSRSKERGAAFAAEYEIPYVYDSYAALVDDPEVDAVYVASPHQAHRDQALLAIEAGKHVLVEKPITTTGADARAIFDAASAAGVFAMEAMWTRYLPQSDIVRQLLADGAIGEARTVAAEFGYSFPYDPDHRLYDPARAGGALFDAGVYPVSFISSVLGPPAELTVTGSLAPSGVDDVALVSLDYGRAVGSALTSLSAWLSNRASIAGSAGRIDIHRPFHQPTGLTVTLQPAWDQPEVVLDWEDTSFAEPYEALSCEADAFASFVDQGLTESPIHPHNEVVAVVDALDRAARQLDATGVDA